MADYVQPRPKTARPRGAARFRIFKPSQGVHVRWATAAGAGALALSGAWFVYNKLEIFSFIQDNYILHRVLPLLVFLASAWLIFWLVGRKQTVVDFLIATEGEMKKVNWSTRREVWGATRVVIVTVLALAIILFVVDVLFILFFGAIGVLRFDVAGQLFGRGTT